MSSLRWGKGASLNSDQLEQLKWHDVAVHAIEFRPDDQQLRLDIDYIVSWPDDSRSHFLVAPASLTFTSVTKCRVSIETASGEIWLKSLARTESRDEENASLRWELIAIEGSISLVAADFTLVIREDPVAVHPPDQRLPSREHGLG